MEIELQNLREKYEEMRQNEVEKIRLKYILK